MDPLRHLGNVCGRRGVGPLAPFAALFVLLVVFAVGGMLVIAHEADRSDASRAREAVVRTFGAMLTRLDSAVEMNAATTPIAHAVSAPQARPEALYAYFDFTSPLSMGYYGTVVLDGDGTPLAGTRFGQPLTGPALAAAARLIAPVAARLPAAGGGVVHGLIRDDRGAALAVAVVNVAGGGVDGGRPARRLAMLAPVVGQLVPYMLPSLGVERFRVGPARPGETAVALPVARGPAIVFAWRPRTPGRAAIARWAPVIGVLLLTALVMLAYAGRSTMAALRALERLARCDHLTGLANRAGFSDELDRRQARGDMVVVGLIDLNGFKDVNDEHGHQVGDGLLVAVAAELAGAAGPGDFVARLGGDEFGWISPSRAAADQLARDFTARLAQPLTVGPLRLQIGAAIGAVLARPEMTASALLAMADAGLYASKHAAGATRRPVTAVPQPAWRRRSAGDLPVPRPDPRLAARGAD